MGADLRENFHLAGRARPLLDCCAARAAWALSEPACVFCDQALETIQHLLLTCPFARQTWHLVLDWLHIPVQIPDQEHTVTEWWLGAKELAPPAHRKALKSIALLVPWMLWNACVFDNATPSIESLVVRIKDEARCWAEAGAQGLRVVLPTTWDVH